jgi:hypothetical protein
MRHVPGHLHLPAGLPVDTARAGPAARQPQLRALRAVRQTDMGGGDSAAPAAVAAASFCCSATFPGSAACQIWEAPCWLPDQCLCFAFPLPLPPPLPLLLQADADAVGARRACDCAGAGGQDGLDSRGHGSRVQGWGQVSVAAGCLPCLHLPICLLCSSAAATVLACRALHCSKISKLLSGCLPADRSYRPSLACLPAAATGCQSLTAPLSCQAPRSPR